MNMRFIEEIVVKVGTPSNVINNKIVSKEREMGWEGYRLLKYEQEVLNENLILILIFEPNTSTSKKHKKRRS